ncbi:uncharacterized protein ASPGLDRAFT_37519 [Aspergillus glaucus CBS 516.65]|uniref:Uncharacterized protein n=1 Tax=Aspergillus glaucus CBS 516.65 TaxID=1160497 RepID=A0A1L9VEA0_ASPGL|nr:hypothetical protein ASPGLDRAFT_37519 [Aspergillus glaucus CBS 516.65]OJJ82223.1 hypothetical protein ASPGLDRAFT_37519 [Aspergillus glaucus CBS 516.65]
MGVNTSTTPGKAPESPGAQMASTYGLKNPRPFPSNTRASGEASVVFEAQGRFYIWNQIQDEVWGVEDPTTEEGIVK